MSEDALSLSKFANVSYDVNHDVSVPSFKMHNSKTYEPANKKETNPKRI